VTEPRDRRLALIDLALGAATALIVGCAAAADISPQRPDGPGAYAFAAGFGALMLLRRSRPVTVLVVTAAGLLGYYALGFPPVGLALPAAAALFSAAEAGRIRWAVGVGAGLLTVSTVARLLTGETARYLLGYELPITLAVMGAAIAFGDGVRSRRRFRDAVVAAAAADGERQVEQERLRVARDVHDVLAHTMSVVTLHADVALEAVEDKDDNRARTALEHIRAAGSDAGRELRRTVGLLRAPPGGDLADLAGVSAAAGLPIRITVQGNPRPMGTDAGHAVYRIVQEAVTNVRRHSRADRVDVLVDYRDRGLRVVVSDDGPPSGATTGAGQGVRGMRERAALLGGTVRAGPRPGRGYEVEAVLPV
jgi:signal transduction histidine kinase